MLSVLWGLAVSTQLRDLTGLCRVLCTCVSPPSPLPPTPDPIALPSQHLTVGRVPSPLLGTLREGCCCSLPPLQLPSSFCCCCCFCCFARERVWRTTEFSTHVFSAWSSSSFLRASPREATATAAADGRTLDGGSCRFRRPRLGLAGELLLVSMIVSTTVVVPPPTRGSTSEVDALPLPLKSFHRRGDAALLVIRPPSSHQPPLTAAKRAGTPSLFFFASGVVFVDVVDDAV